VLVWYDDPNSWKRKGGHVRQVANPEDGRDYRTLSEMAEFGKPGGHADAMIGTFRASG